MDILTSYASAELIVKKSKFLAEIFPCESATKAREILKTQKEKYRDATHVVHAFICGLSAESNGASDDGEPSGTAGKPILSVLKGRNCTNIMLTVTRWFGGTLLGTGGLVKAYSEAAKFVIACATSDKAFEKYVAKQEFSCEVTYNEYEKIKQLLKSFTVYNLHEEFGQKVDLKIQVAQKDILELKNMISEATKGSVTST